METNRIFLVVTEQKRIRGKISFYIAEIVQNIGLRYIDNHFTCPKHDFTSHSDIKRMVVNLLVKNGELTKQALKAGSKSPSFDGYKIILVEGQDLCYVNQFEQNKNY